MAAGRPVARAGRTIGADRGEFLALRVAAGASAVQPFDSWRAACPSATHRGTSCRTRRWPWPTSPTSRGSTSAWVPGSYSQRWPRSAQTSWVDFRVPLGSAADRVGPDFALQGNLDPALLSRAEVVADRVARVLQDAGGPSRTHLQPGSRGALPATADPQVLTDVVAQVHEATAR